MLNKNSLFSSSSTFASFSRADFSLMLVEFLFWNAGVSFLNDKSSPMKYNFIIMIIPTVWALVLQVLPQHLADFSWSSSPII